MDESKAIVQQDPPEEIVKSSNEILNELFSTFNASAPVIVKTEKPDSDHDGTPDKEEKEGRKSKHKKSKKKHKHKDKKRIKREKLETGSDSESYTPKKKPKSSKHKKKKRDRSTGAADSLKKEIKAEGESPTKKLKTEPKVSDAKEEDTIQRKNGTKSEPEPGTSPRQKPEVLSAVLKSCDETLNISKNDLSSNNISKVEDSSSSGVLPKQSISLSTSQLGSFSTKIQIKNLKHSTVYEATIRQVEKEALKKQEEEQKKRAKYEDGEIESDSSSGRNASEYDDVDDDDDGEAVDSRRSRKEKKSGHHKCHHKRRKSSRNGKDEREKDGGSGGKHRSDKDRDKRSDRSTSRSKKDDRKDKDRKKDSIHSDTKYSDSSKYSSKDAGRSDEHRYNPFYRSNNDRGGDDYPSRSKKDDYYSSSSRDHSRYSRDRDRTRKDSRDRDTGSSRYGKDDFRFTRDRDRERDRYRDSDDEYRNSAIDKKKLLEIARKNAINMLKSGSLPGALTLGPQAQEKVIAAIKAGGKTVEELTDFCKTLSRKEELGELSSVSGSEAGESDSEKPFHHPFQIKEKPTSIVMNIKNAIPLPTKSLQEKTSELRMLFPVSSGQQHRKTENEWVPVKPKKHEALPVPLPVTAKPTVVPAVPPMLPPPVPPESAILAIEAPPQIPLPPAPTSPVATVFPTIVPDPVDISSIVSQRLTAMRKLQENPNDVQAISQIYKAQKEMQSWAESKQQPGQFTGSTGAQILSAAELSSGYQAWARKDQLQNAAPVSGGMGMHLLQKMGWRPGEGLGKEKSGTLEPLLLEVKLDKKGLVANEESKNKRPVKMKLPSVKTLAGKHPVSLLGEYASKRKIGIPSYDLCFECGPPHKKNFLFKVTLNGVEYKPSIASASKKQAKADAATVCLQQLGILPS